MSSGKPRIATAAGAAAAAFATAFSVGAVLTPQADAEPETNAAGCHVSGMYEVCLADPEQNGDENGVDLTILNRLREYVQDAAAAGDGVIRGAVYEWELYRQNDDGVHDPNDPKNVPEIAQLVDDLVDANDAGVDVQLIVPTDRPRNQDAVERLEAGGITVHSCVGGCLPHDYDSGNGVMHMKTFNISSGGEQKVAHTSSNLTYGQLKRHENMLTVNGDAAMYDHYLGFWDRMRAQDWTVDGEEWTEPDKERDADEPGSKVYFYPRAEADPVRGTLNKLSCDADNNRVWLAHSAFRMEDNDGNYQPDRQGVLDALDDLESQDCDVRIIVPADDHKAALHEYSGLADGTVTVLDGDGHDWDSHHNKLIVTDALYDADGDGNPQPRTAVYAGSHNLNVNELRRSSDAMVRVTDQGVFDLYADFFETMDQLSRS